jgi:DNA-binding NarL/FixJ family response regulator
MKVLIAEDQKIVRSGICKLLLSTGFIKKIEEAQDGRETIEKAKDFQPDLFLLDYEMPNYNATYATRIIRTKWPDTPVLILSMYQSADYVMDVVNAGVNGIVFKEATFEELTQAIRIVADGGSWFKGPVAEIITQSLLFKDNDSNAVIKKKLLRSGEKPLTSRELEMIKYFVMGHTCAEISEILFISKRTVESHKTNIFRKLDVNNTTRLVKYAMENKLI